MEELKFLECQPGHCVKLRLDSNVPEQVHSFSQKEIHAVNAAIAAGRPLLIRGEPGTGKTQLALAVAVELKRAFSSFVVDARTEPNDLLWYFDAVARLAHAQLLAPMGITSRKEVGVEMDIAKFVYPRALWWGFHSESALEIEAELPPQPDGCSPDNGWIVLIDEIDKAEHDVPNSLLEALGGGRFTPPGRNEAIEINGIAPLIIITTNEERVLPDAFVRRCLVLHLKLPEEAPELTARFKHIGEAHFPDCPVDLIQLAADMVVKDRLALKDKVRTPPGQAEFLDLLRAALRSTSSTKEAASVLEQISEFVLKKHPESFG